MLFRLAYLGITNALALPRLLPMSDRDKDAEILLLRHLTPDPCARSPSPSPNRPPSPSYASADTTDSAGYSTNIDMPPEQHG